MPSYNIKKEMPITRQFADDFDVVITVPALFPIAPQDTIEFVVFEAMKDIVRITKNNQIVRTGQVLKIPFLYSETENMRGKYRWKLRVIRNGIRTRIGEGPFELK